MTSRDLLLQVIRTWPIVAVAVVVSGTAASTASNSSTLDTDDPRLETRLKLKAGKNVPAVLIYTHLTVEAGLTLVAEGKALKQPVDVEHEGPRARDMLAKLEEVLEGRWKKHGDIYVLGPPQGLEEISQLRPTETQRYSQQQWRKLTQSLKRAEWKRLRTGQAIEYRDLSPSARTPALQLARLRYWTNRQSDIRPQLALRWLQMQQIRLQLSRSSQDTNSEIMVLTIYPAPGKDGVDGDRMRIR